MGICAGRTRVLGQQSGRQQDWTEGAAQALTNAAKPYGCYVSGSAFGIACCLYNPLILLRSETSARSCRFPQKEATTWPVSTMSRSSTIKLPPPIDITAAAAAAAASPSLKLSSRSRPRSASLVKVEEVGDRTVEEVLDRSAYANINADWVNAKGGSTPPFPTLQPAQPAPRCMANAHRSYHRWQNYH